MASKLKWPLDSGCFHDFTSCHLIERDGKCCISYVGRLINILKKSVTDGTPFIFSTVNTLKVALELACLKLTDHAGMFTQP